MGGKIGVFPASGGLGSSSVNHLGQLYSASELVLIARSPERLSRFKEAGATVRQADYDSPETLEHAFDGVDTLLLISYASFEIEHRIQVHRRAIDAAIKSGVKHMFYSSLAFAGNSGDHSVAHVMGAHLATEKYLAEQGDSISWTAIREGIYSESFPIYTAWFDPQNPADEITIPHCGSKPGVAWVKRDELGEATAKLIASYTKNPAGFKYLNRKVLLSGQREICLSETIDILGRAVNKNLKIRQISVDEYVRLPQIGDKHTYHGKDLSRQWATAWEAIQNGEAAAISPDIVELLGRQPESYEKTIEALIRK